MRKLDRLAINTNNSSSEHSKWTQAFMALVLVLAVLSLTGCGGGSPDIQATDTNLRSEPPPSLVINEEFFEAALILETPVAGLKYSADSYSGTTDAAGGLRYVAGEEISFQLGSIALGTSLGKGTIVLDDLQLADNEANSSLARTQLLQLLHSFDSDSDPSNGLNIDQDTVEALNRLSIDYALGSPEFLQSPELLRVLQTYTNRSVWVSEEEVLQS